MIQKTKFTEVYIVGKGGRESAIHHFLRQANPNLNPNLNVIKSIKEISEVNTATLPPSLFIIGPEAPLVDGVADQLHNQGHFVFGPSKQAAQLEGSKIFAKKFMIKAQVPTARHAVVDSIESVRTALANHNFFSAPYVLKADGLAGGKGVFICKDETELYEKAKLLFEDNALGAAGQTALLEERLDGFEMSVLALTNGSDFQILPVAQDHKRLKDHQQGPNTGGMGTTAPFLVDPELMKDIVDHVVKPSVQHLGKENFVFRGVLFVGIMIVKNKPYVLEYNVRFGDPETQSVLPLIAMENPVDLFLEIACGNMPKFKVKKNYHSCCVVIAAENYPDQPVFGSSITIENMIPDQGVPEVYFSETEQQTKSSYLLLGGANLLNNQWKVGGGRVLNCVGLGSTASEARHRAYALTKNIYFKGMQFRTDIGKN
ncbi:MAG: phosphoribosylamine--glycine ligase [Pseudobdellovibrionaceae bacterium]